MDGLFNCPVGPLWTLQGHYRHCRHAAYRPQEEWSMTMKDLHKDNLLNCIIHAVDEHEKSIKMLDTDRTVEKKKIACLDRIVELIGEYRQG